MAWFTVEFYDGDIWIDQTFNTDLTEDDDPEPVGNLKLAEEILAVCKKGQKKATGHAGTFQIVRHEIVKGNGVSNREMTCPVCGASGDDLEDQNMTDDYQAYTCRKCHRYFVIYSGGSL